MLFLQYGIDQNGTLIDIAQVGRGKTDLCCPYCSGLLIARKGERIAHHFAHVSDTCNSASRDMAGVALPAYDNFNLHLPGRAVQELHAWAKDHRSEDVDPAYLEKHALLKENDYKWDWYDLTKKGKVVLGQLSLDLFNQFQEPLILARHEKIEHEARKAKTDAERQMYLTDLRLYRMQMRRILTCTLYFLQIVDVGLCKIGVTTRSIEERVREIAFDLQPVFGTTPIKVLGTWSARGNVEHYFKHRYRANQETVGRLTEYYRFSDVKPILRDLRRMKLKILSALEQSIVNGERPEIELQWESEQIEQRRVAAIKPGLERARQKGKRLGRPMGRETTQDILRRPYVDKIREALAAGLSLRDVARAVGVSLGTVQKVKAALGEIPDIAPEQTLLTRSDLPKGNLTAIWKFAAEKYQERWGTHWEWYEATQPYQTDKNSPWYVHVFGFNRYLGQTRREVINNILYVLNTGKDDPIKRLRLTTHEKRILRQMQEQRKAVRMDSLIETEQGVYERLVLKNLVRREYTWGYALTIPGQQLKL